MNIYGSLAIMRTPYALALLLAPLVACRSEPAPAPAPAATAAPIVSTIVSPAPRPAPDYEVPIEVDVDALLTEYRSNELRADARFKDRILRGSGTVSAIGKGPRGGAYISVGTGEAHDRSAVLCTLADADDPLNMRANVGDKVVIEGRGAGQLSYGSVSLVDCRVNPVARLCLRLRSVLGAGSLCKVNPDTGDVSEVTFDPQGSDGGPFSGSYGIVDCYRASAKRALGAQANYARAMSELRTRFPDATFIDSPRVQCLGIFSTMERGKKRPFVSQRRPAIEAFFAAL